MRDGSAADSVDELLSVPRIRRCRRKLLPTASRVSAHLGWGAAVAWEAIWQQDAPLGTAKCRRADRLALPFCA
ncbi:hypothetical protein CSOJ01_12142 [Colletotrichum sojae]|uniref:Uncharacterized protein n=1 Tax=Colletotrichum sojae TaxID=2175907 RepID=A0A8H6MLZ3_9PEZI|nr:hypothetical protein CSOJ01_12142 [Colletotrichum sojae]